LFHFIADVVPRGIKLNKLSACCNRPAILMQHLFYNCCNKIKQNIYFIAALVSHAINAAINFILLHMKPHPLHVSPTSQMATNAFYVDILTLHTVRTADTFSQA